MTDTFECSWRIVTFRKTQDRHRLMMDRTPIRGFRAMTRSGRFAF